MAPLAEGRCTWHVLKHQNVTKQKKESYRREKEGKEAGECDQRGIKQTDSKTIDNR